jgi:ABC-type transport system involved in multi-copper enzyme maturation permease subunit
VGLSTQSGGGSAQLGFGLFSWFAWSQAVLIALLLPALATGAIAQERERRTLEPLLLSPLTPLQIVWGKAVGVLAFACLLLLATVPLTSLCFLLGGVSPGDVIGAYTCLLGLAACVTALGLGCSAKWQNTTQATLMCYVLMPFGFAVLLLGSVPGAVAGLLNVLWWLLSGVARWWKKPHSWLSTRLSAVWNVLVWPALGLAFVVIVWLLSSSWDYGLPWMVAVLPYCALVSRWTMKWAADEIARRPEPRRPTRERVNDLRNEWAQAVAPPPVVYMPSPTGKYTYTSQAPTAPVAKPSPPTYSPARFLPDGRNPVFMRDLRGGLLGKWSYLFRYSYVVVILSEIASPFFASLFDNRSDAWQVLVGAHLMLLLTAGAVFGARALAPEREQQTLPQLLTTPLLPREIVWGKIMSVGRLHVLRVDNGSATGTVADTFGCRFHSYIANVYGNGVGVRLICDVMGRVVFDARCDGATRAGLGLGRSGRADAYQLNGANILISSTLPFGSGMNSSIYSSPLAALLPGTSLVGALRVTQGLAPVQNLIWALGAVLVFGVGALLLMVKTASDFRRYLREM